MIKQTLIKKSLLAMTVAAALAGCTATSDTQTVAKETTTAETVKQNKYEKQLEQVVESYFDKQLELSPVYKTFLGDNSANDKFSAPISDESRAEQLQIEKDWLAKVNNIDFTKLRGQSLLTWEIFKRDRELSIAGEEFPGYLVPINQMNGAHNFFASLGSGSSAQPFNTRKDFEDFAKRADGFAAWMDSAIVAMREGINKNVVLPKALAVKLVPQMQAHIVENVEDSVFWMPVKNMPETLSDEDKAAIKASHKKMILDTLVPVYQRMNTFLEKEYIPASRESVGYSALPNGKAWYEHQIKQHTTLDLGADEIHEIGMQEVNRILDEMIKVKETVGFKGDLAAFFNHLKTSDEFYFDSEQAVIDGYMNVKEKINKRLPQLFEIQPKADYEVKAVEAFRAASAAGASYQSPSPDGSRPGIFYINTHNLKAQPKFLLETLSIHEASPGHHFQISIQQEVTGLPRFRRFGGYTVFAEGWALYAESLGKEMGLFTDPYQWYGRLSDEQLRAMRLVVDTGLHAKGWTREQAIDFMKRNSSLAESDIEAEVERYIAWPGQALSYKMGQRKIRDLRNYAEQALGDKFDIKKFHTEILIDGALPMPTLENKIMRWVKTQQES